MSRITAYLHPKCSTCEQARRWLASRRVDFTAKDIRTTPPTVKEMQAMAAAQEGGRKKLLNTSGIEYRQHGLAAKLPAMDDTETFELLRTNGMLVKRPFVIGPGVALVGFDEKKWAAAFAKA